MSGLEIALWDLAGKAWGVPLYQMLGGKFRDKVRVYGDTDVDGKHTGADMGRAIKKRMDMGFTIVKMDLGIELLYDEPGCIETPRNKEALSDEVLKQKIINSIPCGYIGQAEDISPAVLLLCSEEGRYITGSEIIIDGGMHL